MKTYDRRLDQTITFIRGCGFQNAGAAADEAEAAVFNNVHYQRQIGEAISINDSGLFKTYSDTKRKLMRAVALLNILRRRVPVTQAQANIHGGTSADGLVLVQVNNAYVSMTEANLSTALRLLCEGTVVPPAVFRASTWLQQSQMPNFNHPYEGQNISLYATQDARQAHFLNSLGQVTPSTTRSVYEHLVRRCGKLNWAATNPAPDKATRFNSWVRQAPDSAESFDANCWEMVLFSAFQAGEMTRTECRNLYMAYNPNDRYENTRRLFGNAQAFGTAQHRPRGYILTWGLSAQNIDHVGIYMGTMVENGQLRHFVGHLLSFNPRTTGIVHQVGRVHIERVDEITANLPGYQCFITQPFWRTGSPTHAFFQSLQ